MSNQLPSYIFSYSPVYTFLRLMHERTNIYIHYYILCFYNAGRRDVPQCYHARRHPVSSSSPGVLRLRASVGGRVRHAFTHCLSLTPTVRPSPLLSIHSRLRAYIAGGPATSTAAFYKGYKPPFIKSHSIFRKILFCPEPSLPVVIGAKFSIRAYQTRLHGVSARFYSQPVKSS